LALEVERVVAEYGKTEEEGKTGLFDVDLVDEVEGLHPELQKWCTMQSSARCAEARVSHWQTTTA